MNSVRSGAEEGELVVLRLLDLDDHLLRPRVGGRRHDVGAGGDVVGVADRRPFAGPGLDVHLDPVALELADAVGRHRHPVLGRLDLPGHAHGPDRWLGHGGERKRSIGESERNADSGSGCHDAAHEGVLELRQRHAGRCGRTARRPTVVNPVTGSSTRRRRCRRRADVDAAMQAAADAFAGLARRDAVGALAGPVPHRRRRRGARRGADRAGGREHRQADRPHPLGGDPADGRPDPLLRHRRPPPRGQERRRVHGRTHVVHPPRADRRLRPGRAVELPDDDGGVEVRPGDRRRQHGRAQAERHDAGDDDAARRDRRRVPAARRVQRRSAATATPGRAMVDHPTPAMVSITGSVRAGMEVAGAAAADLKRVHLELGGKAPVVVFDDADIEAAVEGDLDRRLLQRRPGLHGGDPGARRARRLRRLRRRPRRGRPRPSRPACPTTRTCCTGR